MIWQVFTIYNSGGVCIKTFTFINNYLSYNLIKSTCVYFWLTPRLENQLVNGFSRH